MKTPFFKEIALGTRQRTEWVDVTSTLQAAVRDSGVSDGILLAQALHTTAGMTLNENADPDVVRDLLAQLERLAPVRSDYLHQEGNSDAHIKSSLMGAAVTLPIVQGSLALGTWQGVYFCEFDGPRQRKIAVKILEG